MYVVKVTDFLDMEGALPTIGDDDEVYLLVVFSFLFLVVRPLLLVAMPFAPFVASCAR